MRRRTVVVVGASSGIGRATAHVLARRGDHVLLAARSSSDLADVARECRDLGGSAEEHVVDVTRATDLRAVAAAATRDGRRLDGWVNAAGAWSHGTFLDTPEDVLRRVVDVTFHGTVDGTRAALEVMVPQGGGVVVCVSSLYGLLAAPYVAPYVAAKWAVTGFAESVRPELAGTGVELCTVLPGSVDTPIHRNAATTLGRTLRPLPPVVSPEAVAEVVVRRLDRPRPRTVVGRAQLPAVWLHRAAPRTADRVIRLAQDVVAGAGRAAPAHPRPGNLRVPGRHGLRDGWQRRDGLTVVVGLGTVLAGAVALTSARRAGPGRRPR